MMQYLRDFDLNPPNRDSSIATINSKLSFPLPEDYCDFFAKHNGGEGFIGENYLILWKIEELLELNNAYQVNEYALGLFLFGSSGGGEAFCFDLRDSSLKIGQVPFVGMDLKRFEPIADSFMLFLEHLYNDR